MFGAKGVVLQERDIVSHLKDRPYHNTYREPVKWQRMINADKLWGTDAICS